MKIVFLSDDFPPTSYGGAGISTFDLARGMNDAGHEVSVITTCRNKTDAGESEYEGLRVYKIASNYAPRWRAFVSLNNRPVVREVEKIFASIKPDVVHVNNVHFYLSYKCIKVAKKYARKVVFTARDVMAFSYGKLATKQYLEHGDYRTTLLDRFRQSKKRWNPFLNICVRKYLAHADVRVAVSGALKDALVQNGINNVQVIHTGLRPSEWEVSEDERSFFIHEHGLLDKKIIFFGGRLRGIKGALQVLDALKKVKTEFTEAVLLVVGENDDYTEEIKKEAEMRGMSDVLIFTGWLDRSKVKYALASSDVVLVPTISFDAFPRIVLEAMAVGRPVVGTCFGGAQELIREGETGYVVNPLHPEEIADRVNKIFAEKGHAELLGKNGKERLQKDFNLENKVKEYIVVYEK
jgi:glycosyltransferase involved in cell wall biosynthesis